MILAKLKEATREQHEALENTVDVMNRMFTLDDYKALLGKFYRFYAAIEPAVAAGAASVDGFDFEERRKTPLLERDLAALGVLDEVRAAGLWDELPEEDSAAKAFGSMYVMEGATLGGQVITRHLKQHLGIDPETGGAFFNSYGANVGPMWKAFGTAATAFAEEANADEEIVRSAKDTFDSFRKCFEKPLTLIRSAN